MARVQRAADSRDLPTRLRVMIRITRGMGFFVVVTAPTTLEVRLA